MKKMSDTIVFFGSGPVAAESLRLLAQDFSIEAVITKPRPAHHRGSVPVLELAEELELKTFTPTNKAELSALFAESPVRSQVGVVIDYGIIIAQDVIDYFPFGIVNSHFSLLPEWRGADPISFAILSGQTETGVSLMLITAGLDEGPILAQSALQLEPTITTPELTEQLIELSHAMLCEILPPYLDQALLPAPQEAVALPGHEQVSYSRKLTKEDGLLDWTKPAAELEREIRAFIEWPKSRTTIADKEIIITAAHVVPSADPDDPPGQVEAVKATGQVMVTTSDGSLCIDRLKPAGKQEMTARAFLAGYGHLL